LSHDERWVCMMRGGCRMIDRRAARAHSAGHTVVVACRNTLKHSRQAVCPLLPPPTPHKLKVLYCLLLVWSLFRCSTITFCRTLIYSSAAPPSNAPPTHTYTIPPQVHLQCLSVDVEGQAVAVNHTTNKRQPPAGRLKADTAAAATCKVI